MNLDGAFNSLNQITSLDWGGKLDVFGSVGATGVIVKVAGTNAVMYNLTNFLGGAVMHAGSNAIPIVAWLGTNATEMNRAVFMPPDKPQAFLWDGNGNLTNDGQMAYFWNDDNRLIAIESLVGVKRRSEYVIDANSRRVETKDVSGWNGSAYVTTNITRFVWDGFLVLAELAADSSLKAYNIHGFDLSQSLQGAGGIGGLLCSIRGGSSSTSTVFYCFDGNGNVTDLLDTNGAVVAHYEYSPCGKITSQSGPFANENPWRFSSQWHERSWRHYRYVYRVYVPDIGWVSRDPMGERGKPNLQMFVGNTSICSVDPWGLYSQTWEMMIKCLDYERKINQNLTTGDRYIDELVKWLRENQCPFTLDCFCRECPKCGPKAWGCAYPTSSGYPKRGHCQVNICAGRFTDSGAFPGMIRHELLHCTQFCRRTNKNTCKDCLCSEIQAYWWQNPNPAVSDELLKKRAKWSCNTQGEGDRERPCDKIEDKDEDVLMNIPPDFVERCKKSGAWWEPVL